MGCAHDGCTCSDAPVVEAGKNYCSAQCAAGEKTSQGCACAHSACLGDNEA